MKISPRLKAILQYAAMILLTAGLLWLSLRGLKVGEGENKGAFLWQAWLKANKMYLLLMAFTSILSHVMRAQRWRMLLVPAGFQVSLGNSFLSLMVGYLVNLAVPRGEKVSRCFNLHELTKTPVELSFGTVVIERIVDVICMLILVLMAFVAEWTKLQEYIDSLPMTAGKEFSIPAWVIIVVILFIGSLIALFLLRKNKKFVKIWEGFREGFMSLFRLKNIWLFVFYSLVIWGLYFLMTYFVIKAFSETEAMGFSAVLTLFAIGAIAMAVPLPGGAGSYHTLVPLGLVLLYHLPQSDAIAFVFIFHAWQTAILIVAGVVSLIISYWIIQWKKRQLK